jgi:dTDP-4-amino-4,6-dideoxygalactose transaminase
MGRLAINGGTPVRTAPFPAWPVWNGTEEQMLLDVLHSGKWGTAGRENTRATAFERGFAQAHDARHGICVSSGSAALKVALQALDIDYGDEVIVPPYTFVATASSCLSVGALPVFADIDPQSYTLDPARVEEAIGRRTRAIIPVHLGGCPADMDRIRGLAQRHGLRIIEDACQAHAAAWNGTPVGAIGDLGCFSFQSSKNINAGEGGIVLTNDDDLAVRCWSISNCGRTPGGAWYRHELLGDNYRLAEWQAAILLAQLQRMDELACRREENATYLSGLLANIPGVVPQRLHPKVTRHAYHLYVFRYDARAFKGASRNAFVQALGAEGIPCASGYIPLYSASAIQSGTQRLRRLVTGKDTPPVAPDCPVTERACFEEGVWLGQAMLLGDRSDIDDIAEAIAKVRGHAADLTE